MNPEVTEFIENISQPWQVDVATSLRDAVHKAVPEIAERIQYKKPHFLKDGHYAAVISPAKGWVSFTIFNMQDVELPDGLFEKGGPPECKNIKITEGQEVDYDLIGTLVTQASSTL